jgi:N6-adenine-specific methylase
LSTATQKFISENADKDVRQLALQAAKYSNVDMPFALKQIEGKQKTRLKIPTFYNCSELHYPANLSLEQASSEVTANYKSTLCQGAVFTDLTGGFGVDSYFISSQFKQAYYIERNQELCTLAANNFQALNRPQVKVICSDAEQFLDNCEYTSDWIYIDPSRRDKSGKKTVLLTDCEPDITYLYPKLLQKSKRIMIKLSPMIDISSVLNDLPHISQVHILAVENECKELLFIMDATNCQQLTIYTRNFGKRNSIQTFDFELGEEFSVTAPFAEKVENYLYEPNAAIMKSAAFKLIAKRYSLSKLHRNTHLYTSNILVPHFPGRIFEVISLWENKKEWKYHAEIIQKANISTRNYPIGAEELRKKLKLNDGGYTFLFACTLSNESKTIIECKKYEPEI